MTANDNNDDPVVADPTYMANIRSFFTADDISHMGMKSIDLSTYEGVKSVATAIYTHTAPPNANMPPAPYPKWSANRSQTFRNWILQGCPQGAVSAPAVELMAAADVPGTRLRKNVASLGDDEINLLKKAFKALMDRAPTDQNSYFALAGIHGLPMPVYCRHHENTYNPWHRAYLKVFEDQLRTVEGCEDVTLPYWDIRTPLPELLQQPDFANYVLPDLTPGPFTTRRDTPDVITQQLDAHQVFEDIDTSLDQSLWGESDNNGYQDFSIQAHDGGHNSIGPSMRNQNVAAYDPVFWFFHCNLDRLWLSWQTRVGATTLNGFKSTLGGDAEWLTDPILSALPPWETTADQTIEFGISYDELELEAEEGVALENKVGSVEAARSFSIKRSSPVSVRVKDINRLNIPGTFEVHLLADGEPLAKRAFFQPENPRTCDNCTKHALVNIDFRLDQEQLLDRRLSVEIHVPGHTDAGTQFPLSQAGNPTINVRLLLDEQ
jgi:tyrosinase